MPHFGKADNTEKEAMEKRKKKDPPPILAPPTNMKAQRRAHQL